MIRRCARRLVRRAGGSSTGSGASAAGLGSLRQASSTPDQSAPPAGLPARHVTMTPTTVVATVLFTGGQRLLGAASIPPPGGGPRVAPEERRGAPEGSASGRNLAGRRQLVDDSRDVLGKDLGELIAIDALGTGVLVEFLLAEGVLNLPPVH